MNNGVRRERRFTMLKVKYVVVFKKDGLNVNGLLNELMDIGGIIVTDITDDELVSDDGSEKTPVKLYFMESSFSKFFKFKLKYNCVTAEDSQYVLFPMESLTEKMKVEALRAGTN